MPTAARTKDEMLDHLRTNVYRERGTDCLLWAGQFQDTTPMVTWCGSKLSVRRLLAKMSGKQVGRGQWAYATCGNPQCVAEKHVGIESSASRAARVYASGLNPRGVARGLAVARGIAANGNPKLSLIKHSAELRDMLTSGASTTEIARHFRCTPEHVSSRIKRWREMGVAI